MKYINKTFTIEKYNLTKLVNRFETPLYCYSHKKLKQNINEFKLNFKSFSPLICFATKANSNLKILQEIKKNGLGADVVSKGELMKALKAGINSKKIVFSGVGKTSSELSYAIDKKILLINSESKSEILEIEKIAKSKNRIVDIGIRLNPNTDANTLRQISTGKKENKFGVNEKTFIEIFKFIKKSKNINLKCLSVHIGSQILDHKPYEKMLKVIDKLIKKIQFKFEFIDLGGGMGIKKVFIILDAAMNDLMRPALYGAKHQIIPLIKEKKISNKTYDFVGPICETTDKFLSTNKFQKLNEKDLVIICDVGAYGSSLGSNYNVRPKPAEILIKGSKISVIKKRQKLKDLI